MRAPRIGLRRPGRRRAGAALAVAAPALVLAMGGPGGPSAAGPDPAQAADCVPVQHSKTVVKRVKVRRHGRVVKVKRKRRVRWTTCEPVPAPAACAVPSGNLGVIARDATGSTFTLSRSCVSAGQVTVELNNQGQDPHNVFLRPLGGADPVYSIPADPPYELGPLSQEAAGFNLTVGEWYLWCSLLTHEQQGMNAQLSVR